MGSALFPESLSRLKKHKAIGVIKNGRAATQIPAFAQTLSEEEISALVDFIYKPSETSLS
jgi:mono/diheme cytochrome c family protein